MSKSILCERVHLCDSISRLNDSGCLKVIRLLQHGNGCDSLNQWLIQTVMTITQTMNVESIVRINNNMKQILCDDKLIHNHSKHSKTLNISTNDNSTIFPLFRLPIDIIKNTSFFLNEKDIFKFEKCCRLFYQMINNSSYLKQTNNFKTFKMDRAQFDQMIEPKYSFYKYSCANMLHVVMDPLSILSFETNKSISKFVTQTQSKWEQARRMEKYNGHWLTNLFKSIKSLKLLGDATIALLNVLPLNILFDPQSNFQSLEINHFWNCHGNYGHLEKALHEFEKQYLELKEKYEKQNKKIKKLKQMKHVSGHHNCIIAGPRGIETEHLILGARKNGSQVQMKNIFSNSKIKVLTCGWDFNTSKLDQTDCDIKTLTLLGNHFDKPVIEALNLHKSLINLTMKICISLNYTHWTRMIEKVLLKQEYHNLKNVNILITQIQKKDIILLFHILKKNVGMLKYQFNKLNFGLQISCETANIKNLFTHTFEWNCQIDRNFLDTKEQELLQCQERLATNAQHKKNFDKLLNQWLQQ